MVKTLTLYKRIVEELGLRQLDVYRVSDGKGGLKDVIRILDPTTNKVFTIDLGRIREAVKPLEFLEALVKASSENGVTLPERKVNELREAFSREEASEAS